MKRNERKSFKAESKRNHLIFKLPKPLRKGIGTHIQYLNFSVENRISMFFGSAMRNKKKKRKATN